MEGSYLLPGLGIKKPAAPKHSLGSKPASELALRSPLARHSSSDLCLWSVWCLCVCVGGGSGPFFGEYTLLLTPLPSLEEGIPLDHCVKAFLPRGWRD